MRVGRLFGWDLARFLGSINLAVLARFAPWGTAVDEGVGDRRRHARSVRLLGSSDALTPPKDGFRLSDLNRRRCVRPSMNNGSQGIQMRAAVPTKPP